MHCGRRREDDLRVKQQKKQKNRGHQDQAGGHDHGIPSSGHSWILLGCHLKFDPAP